MRLGSTSTGARTREAARAGELRLLLRRHPWDRGRRSTPPSPLLESFGRQLINSDTIRYTIAATTAVFWLGYFYLPRRRPGA